MTTLVRWFNWLRIVISARVGYTVPTRPYRSRSQTLAQSLPAYYVSDLDQTTVRIVWLVRLAGCLFLVIQALTTAQAQHSPAVVSLNYIPTDGFLLKEGWRFQAGDNPNGADPQLDDSQWRRIDPTKAIRDLPQLRQAGIGWLRLHLRTGKELPPLMIKVFQSVASEIYLDGRLLYRFGTVSAHPDQVKAYDPRAVFSLPLQASSEHVLALRVACQPGFYYTIKSPNWHTDAIEYWLFSSSSVPTLKLYDAEQISLSAFKVGIAFILFILHLSLFLAYRTTQRTNLYAAGMYLMLCVTFLARAADYYTHSLENRLIIHYGSLIDVWVPCLSLLTVYSLFNFRKGWLCWLAIGSIVFVFIPLPANYQWLSLLISYFLPFEFMRLSLMAVRRKLLGARIVAIGTFSGLGMWIANSILAALHITAADYEWFINVFYVVSFLGFPLTLSLRLALEHGWVSRQLRARLEEVETLSARNLAQQQERQQILAQQNELLEQQVAERTHELHQQADQLRQLDQVKSRFVTNMTHEFRTPLSLILSPVEKLLQEGRFDRPLLTLIQRNARQLLRLINQLLDLSKLEGNHMTVSLMQGEITSFIHSIVDVFRRAAEQKHVTLTCAVGQFPPQPQVFDADKWEKILTNLLANALKFTPVGGQVTLTLTPVWEAGEIRSVQVQLTDSGIGIAPDQLPHIFNRFYQVDTSNTRAYGGTGIGLALVKELVDLLKGTIMVESEPGAGTTFRLNLPVQADSTNVALPPVNGFKPSPDNVLTPSIPVSVTDAPDKKYPSPQILVVEDKDELREFLVSELAVTYQVLQAVDGESGWALIQNEPPDIVLTDVMMPRLDGYGLTRLIKSHAHTDHIAVIMLTARATQQSRLDGLQQGADDYITKPFSVDELLLRVQNLLSRQRRLRERLRNELIHSQVSAQDEQPPAQVNTFIAQFYALIDQRLSDPNLSVEDLAHHLHLNRTSLHRKVKALVDLSPGELIRSYRLKRASEFLRQGFTSSETAFKVGFDSPAYFTKCFREQFGQTPSEYAQQAGGRRV